MTPILEVEDLTVALGGRTRWIGRSVPPVQAVRGVSLAAAPGEVLGIVGESGCGKTTLGRTILGLQRESGGRILLDGALVSGLAPQAARRVRNAVHYVHQDAGASLDPWWSIGRALEEALVVQGIRDRAERRARIAEVLEAVGLDAAAGRRYPHEFSGGQLRRVALARILALRPRIVVLDEPTSGLDMSVQAMVLTLLRDLQVRYGLTYLFISHDLSVVRRFCDRVAIMYLGRTVEQAPVAQIFAAPRHPYTRSLLAAAPRLSGRRVESAPALQGEPPSAARLPPGCAFAPRCAMAEDLCHARDPVLSPHGAALVACHRAAEPSPAASAGAPGYATVPPLPG
jgi:oligopeptide/dipeptide ABC transporter ATP-binding protein